MVAARRHPATCGVMPPRFLDSRLRGNDEKWERGDDEQWGVGMDLALVIPARTLAPGMTPLSPRERVARSAG